MRKPNPEYIVNGTNQVHDQESNVDVSNIQIEFLRLPRAVEIMECLFDITVDFVRSFYAWKTNQREQEQHQYSNKGLEYGPMKKKVIHKY